MRNNSKQTHKAFVVVVSMLEIVCFVEWFFSSLKSCSWPEWISSKIGQKIMRLNCVSGWWRWAKMVQQKAYLSIKWQLKCPQQWVFIQEFTHKYPHFMLCCFSKLNHFPPVGAGRTNERMNFTKTLICWAFNRNGKLCGLCNTCHFLLDTIKNMLY